LENTPDWHYSFAKVHDVRTVQLEDNLFPIHNMGVGIDVFPIDNAPDDLAEWMKYEQKRKFLRDVYSVKELGWRKGRLLWKNIFAVVCSTILRPIPYRNLAVLLSKYAQKYNTQETDYYAENCLGRPNNRFPKSDFGKTIDVQFEECRLCAMEGYDDYLRLFYGDYMQLPPVDKRRQHYRTISYWKE
jgi:lipopolysaccharide cholinephosphotransferase